MQLFGTGDPAATVTQALRQASRQTGVGFDYLLNTAMRESSLDTNAAAERSSASGLFQFIEQTWLETLKTAGEGLGLGHLAAQVERGANGRYTVADAGAREDILALRNDPQTAALMAGALTRRNAAQLASNIGRQPTSGELYIAHFLGAGDASKLIQLARSEPQANASASFPAAARANPSIFNTRSGTPRSAEQVYALLVRQPQAADAQAAVAARDEGGRSETGIAGFFNALLRPSGGGAARAMDAQFAARPIEGAQGGGSTQNMRADSARPAEPMPGEPLRLASFMRPGVNESGAEGALASHFRGRDAAQPLTGSGEPAAQRLAARGAYNTQVRWFSALYRT